MISFSELEKDNLHKWAVFLRETSLPQGKNALSRNGHYCCLGVWAENTLGPEHWIEESYPTYNLENGTQIQKEKTVDGMWSYVLPEHMERVLGLHHEIAEMPLRRYFWIMNDLLNLSFPTIAEHIDYLLEHETFSDDLVEAAIAAFESEGKVLSSF